MVCVVRAHSRESLAPEIRRPKRYYISHTSLRCCHAAGVDAMDILSHWVRYAKDIMDSDATSSTSLLFKDPHTLKLAKEALIAGIILVGVVYVVQSLLQNRKPNQSWLKLRRQSPDPEKNDDPGRYAAQRMKPSDRKPGSKYSATFFIGDERNG